MLLGLDPLILIGLGVLSLLVLGWLRAVQKAGQNEHERHSKSQRSTWSSEETRGKLGRNSSGSPREQGRYGAGVRAQVFEVIVKQALAGAPWRDTCAGPMEVNGITLEEVEEELRRRRR